jgi:hypothetical protein
LKKWTGDDGTVECKSQHDERPVQVETQGNNWIQVITGHHKRYRKTKTKKKKTCTTDTNWSHRFFEACYQVVGGNKYRKGRS